jgi:Gametolysin peptidase M11
MLDVGENATDTEVHSYHCKLDDDNDDNMRLYPVALPADFIQSNEMLFNYNPVLNITNAQVMEDSIKLSPSSNISIHQETSPHRRLAPKSGSPTVLSVYVTSTYGQVPDSTVDDIKNGIFGTGLNNAPYNTLKQYKDCSYGALTMQPATLGNVDGGVVQVQVNRPLDASCDMDSGTCSQDITNAAIATLGRPLTDYDMIMFCLPTGVVSGGSADWAAYAYTGYRMSFFSKGYCSIMTTVGHELGHLMGFGQ